MIKLIVMDAMQAHWRIRGDHEIERGARWPAIKKRCWEAARRNSLVADKCDAHETARGMRLQLEELTNLVCCQTPSHLFLLNIERQRSNIQCSIV